MTSIAGGVDVDPRIARGLEQALELGEVGLQIAVYQGDELVVDAWAGATADGGGRDVDSDTLFPVFSVSKAYVATAVHVQAERGLLDVDAPIARYWPEYAANGKNDITLRHVLEHRAGVPQMPPDLTPERLLDWDAIVEWLAGVTPLCPPGERSMYHSLSFGYLLGEVLRRTDPGGRPFDQVVRDELTQPFGIDDVWFGVPPEHEHRIAQLTWGAEPPSEPHVKPNPIRAMMMPAGVDPGPGPWNTRAAHAACVPAAGGIMTARAGARFMAVLANGGVLDGVRLVSEERLRACARLRPNPDQIDEGIGRSTTNGVGGYFVGGPNNRPGTLAAGGAGGSVAWADLDARVGVAITHNRMFADLPEHPFAALIAAVNDITGVQAGAAGGAS